MPFITQGKTNWKFLLIVVILAGIVGGGILWWQYRLPPEEEICKNQCGDGTCQEIFCLAIGCSCPETKENCPQDCGAEDETADTSTSSVQAWQTYRNEEYGFEVKYPEDWKFTTSSPSYEGSSSFETLDFSSLPPKLKGARLIVSTYQFKNELYKDWQTQVKGEGLTPNLFTTVDINKKECLKMMQEVKEYNSIAGIERYTESVSCTNDDGTRIVTLFIELERVNKEKYLAVFNQILSTFRFLEPVFVSPRGMEQWKIGETHTIEINRPVEDSYPFTHLTLNKADGEEIGIIACKIGGTGKTYFDWETNIVLKFCGASSEEKIKNIEPGNYIIAITEDLVGERPILASSELFSIIGE